jgi:hypothetical protein
MLKKLTRTEAHKAMDDGKFIFNGPPSLSANSLICAWRNDNHPKGPYLVSYANNKNDAVTFNGWEDSWYLEVPWRPVEGEAVYIRNHKDSAWIYSIYSHTDKRNEYIFCLSSQIVVKMIAPVKGNEGSAGTTKDLKNTLTAEDLK